MSFGRVSALAVAVGVLAGTTPAAAAQAQPPEGACAVSSWQMAWGVKESFRSYLSGAIAQGEWTTEGDVTYDTPSFIVNGTEGWISPDGQEGMLTAEGSMRFYGHGGIMDQTLSAPAVMVGESVGIVFDVSGDTREGMSVDAPGVVFVTSGADADIDATSGIWSLSDAPTVLTEEGAAAFGNYPAGTEFDPVTITVNVEPGCLEQPRGPLGWVVSLSVLATALAAAVTVGVRRRRGPEHPTPRESSGQSPE